MAAEGSPSPAFQWYKNGVPLPGETDISYVVPSADTSDSGTYSCEMRNLAGTFVWLEMTVSVV